MSTALVVSAHPLEQSLCAFLTQQIKSELTSCGVNIVHRDLYAQGFDPRLRPAERASFYTEFDQSCVAQEVAELEAADILILVFPTWWFGFPAILKGWFDRVWAPGVAFDHADDLSALHPRLDNLRHVIAVTTLGSPWWIDRLILWRPVRRVLKTAIVGVCASKAKFDYIAQYKAEKMNQSQLEHLERRTRKAIHRAIKAGS